MLKEQELFEDKINWLLQYYQEKGLTIFGFHDLCESVFSSVFSENSLLDDLASNLTTDSFVPFLVDAFSPVIHKPQHIQYMLENNLSLEDVKLSKLYGNLWKIAHVFDDEDLFYFLESFMDCYYKKYKIDSCDYDIYLTDLLRESAEPLIVYSSGFRDLVQRYLGFKNNKKKADFNYNYLQLNDSFQVLDIMDKIKRNFESFLDVNSNSDIIVLGCENEINKFDLHSSVILQYYDALKDLCSYYQLTYLDLNDSKKKFGTIRNKNYFITMAILNELYDMKINKTYGNRHKINTNFKQTNEGVRGMIRSIDKDYNHTFVELDGTYGYEREKVLDRARVQLEERRVFEKVLRNKKV